MENTTKISDAELLVMLIVWESEEHPDLYKIQQQALKRFGRDWKLQTIATFMKRLEKKKFIFIYKVGRYSHYQPLIEKEVYRKIAAKEMLELLFDNNPEKAIECFRNLV